MATTLTPMDALGRSPALVGQARKPRLVLGWAVIGAGFLALIAYVITAWVVTGKATPTPTGVDEVPAFMTIAARAFEIGGIAALGAFAYYVLIRPWRREGRMTLDGMFLLAFLSLYWQDPLLDYSQTWLSYNSVFVNLGSWTTNVPGWIAPHANLMPEPIVFVLPSYAYVIFGVVILLCRMMTWAKARWPHLGPVGLVGICFAASVFFDLLVEPPFMVLGFYHYGGSIPWLTLFHGSYFQFPVYEAVVWGATWTLMASLRYFRDDKGRTLAERGIDDVRVGRRKQTGLRLLAIIGVLQLIFLCAYNIPIQFFALHSAPWPKDITSRSYMTNGLCGPGTAYACPGPGVPIPRPDSAHLDPNGKLVVP